MKKSYLKQAVFFTVSALWIACSENATVNDDTNSSPEIPKSSSSEALSEENNSSALFSSEKFQIAFSSSSEIPQSSVVTISSESENNTVVVLGGKPFSYSKIKANAKDVYTIKADTLYEVYPYHICRSNGNFETEIDTSVSIFKVFQDSLHIRSFFSVTGSGYVGLGNTLENVNWERTTKAQTTTGYISYNIADGDFHFYKKWSNGKIIKITEKEDLCWSSHYDYEKFSYTLSAQDCNSLTHHLPEGDLQIVLQSVNRDFSMFEIEALFAGKRCGLKVSTPALELNAKNCQTAWNAFEKDPQQKDSFSFNDYKNFERKKAEDSFENCLKDLGVKSSLDSLRIKT